MNNKEADKAVLKYWKDYAKMVFLVFYSFRELANLKPYGTYWEKFIEQHKINGKGESSMFWDKGFEILQNI